MARKLLTFFSFLLLPILVLGAEPSDSLRTLSPDPAKEVFDLNGSESMPPPNNDNLVQELIVLEQRSEAYLRAKEKVRNAISLGRFIQKLDSLAWIEFPVVLADTISNIPVSISFDDLRLYPEYAQLEVIVGMELPQKTVAATEGANNASGQQGGGYESLAGEYVELYFGTPNLKFSHDGGIIGDATIGLYSDIPIGTTDPSKFGLILRGWHEHGSGTSAQNLGTYVVIDCDGFVEMGVEADVLFSRDWIVPVAANGDTLPTGRVQGSIQTIINDWNNMLVEISLPNFALASYPDVAFNLSNAVFDFSDYRNSPNVQFPPNYLETYLPPGNPNLWRGVYIKNLEVTLPKQLSQPCAGGPPAGNNDNRSGFNSLLLDRDNQYALNSEGTELHLSRPPPDLSWDTGQEPAANFRGPSPPEIPMPPTLLPPTSTEPAAAPQKAAPAKRLPIPYAAAVSPLPNVEFPVFAEPKETAAVAGCRTKIGVDNLLIDGQGVSGLFYAQNVLNFGDGAKMDRWKFSVTSLSLEVRVNQLVGFGFGGELVIPIAKEGRSFSYDAFVNVPDKTWHVTVTAEEDMVFPVLKMAEVGIDSASYINITSTPETFVPTALLYGFAAIKAKKTSDTSTADGDDSQVEESKLSFTAAKLTFEGIKLSTASPKFDMLTGGFVRFEHDPKLLGFPLPIADPELKKVGNDKMRFTVTVELNLMNSSDNGFAAGTSLSVDGLLVDEGGADKWKFDNFTINSIYAELRLPSLEIIGYAHVFDEDPIYGKGFQGSLSVKIGPDPGSPMFSLELNAIFGKVDYRYWYVDGMFEMEAMSIPLVPGVIDINGFGGGAYYHMKMESANLINGGDGSLGTLPSGVRYVPDDNVFLGLKASIALRSPNPGPETLDGVATLELVFGNGGLQEIMFYGQVEIVSPKIDQAFGGLSEGFGDRVKTLEKTASQVQGDDEAATENPVGSILASLFLRLNFEGGFEIQGTFRCKLDAAQGIVKGEGGIDFLMSTQQNKWHLYVGGYHNDAIIAGDGQPLPPISVTVQVSSSILLTCGAYFLIGNDIPGPPPLHPAVAAFFGSTNNNNRSGLSGKAALGTGFAFGAYAIAYIDVRIRKKGKYSKNRFKGNIGAGFDVSLLKYKRNTRCGYVNRSPHGHKGWRATGRLYAYIDGHAKYRGIGKSLTLGVLIEGDLPKPTYMKIHIVVGIGPFDVNVKVKIGTECGPPIQL